MEQRIITFTADQQGLTKTGGVTNYASDTISYVKAIFTLGENWTGFDEVRAVFKTPYTCKPAVLDSLGECIVPWEVLMYKGIVRVNLVGSIYTEEEVVDRLTTHSVEALVVDEDVPVCGGASAPLTPSEYEQFVAKVATDANRAEAGATSAETSAGEAETSATASAQSATASANSASQAQTYSQNAQNSAISAENAKDDAEEARDEILGMRATANTLAEGSDATASYSDGLLTLGIPRGNTGAKGDKGDTGATPNLSIGTVETLPPTGQSQVTIAGTAENPVLSFKLVKGDTGEVAQAEFDEAVTDLKSEISDNADSISSAVSEGYANTVYGEEKETDTDLASCTSNLTGNSSGLNNGWYARKDCLMVGIKLHPSATPTSFSVFILNSDHTLAASYLNLTPTIQNQIVTFDEPIPIHKGQIPCIRQLGGKFYYYQDSTAIYDEWVQSVGYQKTKSRGGYEVIYKSAEVVFNDSLSDIKESLNSAVDAGVADFKFSETDKSTETGKETYSTSASQHSNAYWNGAILPRCLIKGIKLNTLCTSTSFDVYVFDTNFALAKAIEGVSPTITDHAFSFADPILLDKGGTLMIVFKDGTWYAYNTGTSDYKKYTPSTNTISNETLRACYDIVYDEIEQIVFKNGIGGDYSLTDFPIPKCKMGTGEYTLIGRWFDKNGYKTTNTDGASILTKVSGATSVTLTLETLSETNYTPYFACSLDGSSFTRQLITSTTIAVPDDGEHILWIVIDGMGETDPQWGKWNGTVGIRLKALTSDGTLKGLEPKNKQIYIVGDSMVEGINVLGSGANANVNSAINGFAWKTARKLNSLPLLCGYGGSGILSGGSFSTAINSIKYNMNGAPINEMNPDVIMIEYGYNDQSVIAGGTKTVQDFIDGYKAVIEWLRVNYPGVPILCMIPFAQVLRGAIETAASNYSECKVIETFDFTVTTSDNTHPDVNGANVASSHLAEKIRTILGNSFF